MMARPIDPGDPPDKHSAPAGIGTPGAVRTNRFCGDEWHDTSATTATQRPSGLRITASDWKSIPKGCLLGFVTLTIENIGLSIAECCLLEKEGKRWISMPSKPMIGRDGTVMKDQAGKVRYSPILTFGCREQSDRFQAVALAAVDRLVGGAA
jgi:hypothetical protein